MGLSWDIFCKVVDNFGDIGVAWRLARQLASEQDAKVRLWVDDLESFRVLVPSLQIDSAIQWLANVEVRHWHDKIEHWPQLHQIAIEAFACNLPESLLTHMTQQTLPPVWINLEYLSAEDWVKSCHKMQSHHPRLPLTQHFFFPGFAEGTGGLICETGLLQERERFCNLGRGRWRTNYQGDTTSTLVSLFCYDNAAIHLWLDRLVRGTPTTILVADGKPRMQVEAWLGQSFPHGASVKRQALQLVSLPFLSQQEYDRLLWSCDINFVRGEDSCARSQWAAEPFVWHIYPTEDAAHVKKLDALLQYIRPYLTGQTFSEWHTFTHAWNAGDGMVVCDHWSKMLESLPELKSAMQQWRDQVASIGDLAGNLAEFVRDKL